jgi:large subunit ribosomal protein L25
MLQDNVVIEVEKRLETGKNAANRLRAADKIPAVLYGGGKGMETWSLQVPRKALVLLLRKGLHGNAIFQLKLAGTDQLRHVMIRDLSIHPVSRFVQHVDFVRILLDRKLRVKVPVEMTGIADGVKNEGGLLNVVTHELLVETLPADIPASITIDVSHLKMHENIRVQDLKLGDKVRVLEPGDRLIVHVAMPKHEEVAVAATAAPVEGAAAASAEPEVIKKGKKEEEGAEGAKPAEKGAKPAAKPAEKGKK